MKPNVLSAYLFMGTCLAVTSVALSGEKDLSRQTSFGIGIGVWQPHSLNDEPRFYSFGKAGATPFVGCSFTFPVIGDIGFRFSLGYWSVRDLKKSEDVHSLILHPVCVDVKYWLVPDAHLSAYALYGGGAYLGFENEKLPFSKKLHKARLGWGANLGAGFDLAVSRSWGIGMVFQYHYVRFKKPLGGVDDFSGPKISGELFFLF